MQEVETRVQTAKVFRPLLEPMRFKGAYGGRGSGKSHFFAELMVEKCIAELGTRAICIREVQKDLSQSSKALVEGKIRALGLTGSFRIFGDKSDKIETPGGGIITFQGMKDHTAESIKSLEAFKYAWVDEAHTLSERSLSLLRPTIRVADSELWFSWNPTRKVDAVDKFFREMKPERSIAVQANWRDNPWWGAELELERQTELKHYPDRYPHTWDGEYARAFEGAYYAGPLALARAQGRIGRVSADPLLPVKAFFDIGGSGASSDAMAIWVAQFVAREIRVLDYIEGQGQPLGYYTELLRTRGWSKAICVLPHDGINANNITGKRYVDHLRDAGFEAPEPIPNQGKGAASMRIEAARRLFPQIYFNEATTEAGRDALGYYHEKKHEQLGVGLGPEHDWSSHAADAFGLMCVAYQAPSPADSAPLRRNVGGYA